MTQRYFIAVMTGAWFVFCIGCSTGGEPPQRALAQSHSVVVEGVEAAIDAVHSQEIVTVRGRYNPCRCPAPAFEVYVHGNWIRTILDGDGAIIDAIEDRAAALEVAPRLEYFRLTGKFDGMALFEETNAEYERFELVEFRVE